MIRRKRHAATNIRRGATGETGPRAGLVSFRAGRPPGAVWTRGTEGAGDGTVLPPGGGIAQRSSGGFVIHVVIPRDDSWELGEHMSECLDNYLDGWRKGDPDMIVNACAGDFVLDDPIEGRFPKADFGKYWDVQPEGAVEFSDVVTEETEGSVTQWGWWTQAGQTGSFMNKADEDGVHLTRVTYYAR
jgi:hypothetical protein